MLLFQRITTAIIVLLIILSIFELYLIGRQFNYIGSINSINKYSFKSYFTCSNYLENRISKKCPSTNNVYLYINNDDEYSYYCPVHGFPWDMFKYNSQFQIIIRKHSTLKLYLLLILYIEIFFILIKRKYCISKYIILSINIIIILYMLFLMKNIFILSSDII